MVSKTTCNALWSHLAVGNHPSGQIVTPCCRFNFKKSSYNKMQFQTASQSISSENYFLDIQKRMQNGEKLSECNKCWLEESQGITSMRQKFNRDYTVDYNRFELQYIEIMFSNLCNLACRMCDITQSSQWANLYNKAFVPSNIKDSTVVPEEFLTDTGIAKTKVLSFDWKIIEDMDLSKIKRVKILGGEPMMSPDHEIFVQKLIEQSDDPSQLSLTYHTNCTKYPSQQIIDHWQKIKDIKIVFSIDGYQQVNEYQRVYSDWNQIVQTMLKFKNLDCNKQLHVHSVLTPINIWSYNRLIDWITDQLGDNSYSFDFVQQPNYLCLGNMPDTIKQKCKDIVSKFDNITTQERNLIIEFINSRQYNENNWKQFINTMTAIDNHTSKSLLNAVPELKEFIS